MTKFVKIRRNSLFLLNFRSTQIVYQDEDYALVTVTLFQKVVDEFKHKARENKFVVRDFVYNPEELQAGKNELTKLATDKKKQFGPLVKIPISYCFHSLSFSPKNNASNTFSSAGSK